ncbi:MAG: hypothetical protein OHK0036_11470 [Bacteroidia bacterium]
MKTNNINLLENEIIIKQQDNLTLTNYRVILISKKGGTSHYESGLLSELCGSEITYKTKFIYFVLMLLSLIGAILGLISLMDKGDDESVMVLLVSSGLFLLFLLLYFLTKKVIFIVYFSGHKISNIINRKNIQPYLEFERAIYSELLKK